MAKKNYTSTSTTPHVVAIVMIATVMILSLIGVGLCLTFKPDIPAEASSTTSVTTPPPQESQPAPDVQENENVPSIGIRDMSVSMSAYVTAVAGYDTWSSFGQDGTSCITTAVVDALEKGYKRIGIVTDLESYPTGEMLSISGKHYQDIELTFFVPASVDEGWLNRYSSTFVGALDPTTCTLKFVDMNGKNVSVLYNNFKKVAEVVPEPSVTTVTATTTTTLKEGNSVPLSLVIIVIEVLFLIVMGLIIAIITRCCCGCTCTPVHQPIGSGVTRALQQSEALALDGSGSVEPMYKKFINWAENAGWGNIYRFAGSVEEMKISRAKHLAAGGGTLGYTALKQLFDDGYKVVTVVSDMLFGDDPNLADGVMFEKIFFVGENLTEESVKHLTKFCKSYEIVSI